MKVNVKSMLTRLARSSYSFHQGRRKQSINSPCQSFKYIDVFEAFERELISPKTKQDPSIFSNLQGIKISLIGKLQEQISFCRTEEIEINHHLKEMKLSAHILIDQMENMKKHVKAYGFQRKDQPQLKVIAKHLILQSMLSYINNLPQEDKMINKIHHLVELELKLRYFSSYFQQFQIQKNILNSQKSDYEDVWTKITVGITKNQQIIVRDYKRLSILLKIFGGAILQGEKYTYSLFKSCIFSMSVLFSLFRFQKSQLTSLLFFKQPNLANSMKLLNLSENFIIKKMAEMTFDKINTNKMIYIPAFDNTEDFDILHKQKDSIPVRVLFHKDLALASSSDIQIEDALIHIHGGGFVALTSHTTQNFTRRWANELKIPVFSIDYRMPPDHPYPQASYDCLRVYKFLINQIHKYLKIRAKNIFIAGDSAGGNLACSLTALILKQKLQKPMGIYLVYPSLDLRPIYYPSRSYILQDSFLNPSLLSMFLKIYVKNYERVNQPLASPLLITEQFISGAAGDRRFALNWPRTYITVGMKDPLRDQSLLLMQKMVLSGIDCKLHVFMELSHGYLTTEHIVAQSTVAIKHSIQDLKLLIQNSKEQPIGHQQKPFQN